MENFDCDSDSVSPDIWRDHFTSLLGAKVGPKNHDHEKYIQENIDKCNAIFDEPLTKVEILDAIKNLKNGKSASFDKVSNEMLKASMPTLLDPILLLFKTMIENSWYSNHWKSDILTPVHKTNAKDDLNNNRGIAVSSHFGKLFNAVLKNRLQKFCDINKIINPEQISGRKSSRPADHLTVIRFLIEKYALQGKKKTICMLFLRSNFVPQIAC